MKPNILVCVQRYHAIPFCLHWEQTLVEAWVCASLLQLGRDLQQYQSQAKQLFRKLNEQSPSRCTLEAGSMSFQWVWKRPSLHTSLWFANVSLKKTSAEVSMPVGVNLCRLSPTSYLIEKGVCYLVLCEGSFPKKLAFAYLEDLQAEFHEQHGKRVPTVSRPYSFIEFGMAMMF